MSWLPAGARTAGRVGDRRVLIPLLVTLVTALAVNAATSFRVNLSGSMPRGLYRLTADPPRRGSIVAFCLDEESAALAVERRYTGSGPCPGGGEPLVKPVAATEGDVVTTTRRSVTLNGIPLASSTTLVTDSNGRPLPHHPFGRYRLAPGELWVFSPAPRSWDSRYLGPIRRDQVVATVVPILTIR
ncbi:MAG: conjugative transfer signal peptidase TraF [Candidatus Binatia bacterium]